MAQRLTVPFGLLHISFKLNSSTLASSGVMVAHLTPTECSLIALAESMVTWSLVYRVREAQKPSEKVPVGGLPHLGSPCQGHST